MMSNRTTTTGDSVRPLGQEDPLEEEMATTPIFLPGKKSTDRGAWQTTVHGSLKESDTTEQLSTHAARI